MHAESNHEPPKSFDAIAIDRLPTTSCVIFDDYADSIFLPHLKKQLDNCLDLVWNTYITGSIKTSTREKRGQGIRRKVAGKNEVPTDWKSFLRCEKKQAGIFEFLAKKATAFNLPVQNGVCSMEQKFFPTIMTEEIALCDHKEADNQACCSQNNGHRTCLVRTVDNDVVVILIGKFSLLSIEFSCRYVGCIWIWKEL